ncbi:NUDIX hydrolase [Micromonospora sp. WMMD710]|uniref:NUDIX domain-containing protein n=1 Tax=Micromonospora sp. WMMD710 TaxID=3016085 RepID=UPI002417C6BF|nr:NUDIX hydrolase [Micromonospora sp. WMMD710]MDG4761338.1 NUDIX hydrolase [Micromonospora sp. WMMD710]
MPSERRDVTAGMPRKRMAAGLLITDADERVLLVEPVYKASWEIPGGCVEADESPYQAAIRECREELGLDLAPGRLLVVDWVPARAGRAEGVMVVFDGGTLEPRVHERIVVPPGELKGWAFSDPPEAAQRLPPLLTRRITEALNARADGCSYYLEDGVRVT